MGISQRPEEKYFDISFHTLSVLYEFGVDITCKPVGVLCFLENIIWGCQGQSYLP